MIWKYYFFQKRHVLEENNELETRVSLLENDDFDLDEEDTESEEEDEDFEEKKRIAEMLDKAKQSSKDDRRDRDSYSDWSLFIWNEKVWWPISPKSYNIF